jgi:hypothetical protein
MGIQTATNMAHHVISAPIVPEFSNRGKRLVVQYTVKIDNREYSFCAGGYIKLIPRGMDPLKFDVRVPRGEPAVPPINLADRATQRTTSCLGPTRAATPSAAFI